MEKLEITIISLKLNLIKTMFFSNHIDFGTTIETGVLL